jgi:HSP20 family protein
VFSRQLILGDTLDTERVQAGYDAGVLTLRIPVAEKAKPRKIQIAQTDSGSRQLVDA